MPRKVYLQPVDLVRHSRHHRAYAGEGAIHEDGKPGPLYVLEFWDGVAYDVPEPVYQRFKDLGIADIKPPILNDQE